MKKLILCTAAVFSLLFAGCAADVAPASEELRQACGGIAGLPCPDGYLCVDDPRDDCDPQNGGADCMGICRRDRCTYDDPSKTYVGRSLAECQVIRFVCDPGSEHFADECGCGCQETASACAERVRCPRGSEWNEDTCSCELVLVPVPDPIIVLPGRKCGETTCGAGMVCCNASCGICTPPGGACTQQICPSIR